MQLRMKDEARRETISHFDANTPAPDIYEGPVPPRVFAVAAADYDDFTIYALLSDEAEAKKLRDELRAAGGQERWEVYAYWLFPTAAEARRPYEVIYPEANEAERNGEWEEIPAVQAAP